MKKIYTLLIIGLSLLFCIPPALSQTRELRAYLSYASFWIPGQGSFLETYLAVEGQSAVFVEVDDGRYQALIEVSIIFRKNDEIVDFAKYEFKSPFIEDTLQNQFGFIDQQRFALADGAYEMEFIISDLNNPEVPAFSTFEKIELSYPEDEIHISGIQLVEQFSPTSGESLIAKSGYDLIPKVYAFYPESEKELGFYCEVYHAENVIGNDSRFMVNYFVESFERQSPMSNYFFRRRMEARPVNSLLNKIDIGKLPSGNYNLVVEVRDRNNELLAANKVFFQKSNPGIGFNLNELAAMNTENSFVGNYTNVDTLAEYILCLAPISSEIERSFAFKLVAEKKLQVMQQYFYNFWLNRSYTDPELAWRNYFAEVQKVNQSFSTINRKGYDTDRGRVYLQYGPPNHLTENYSEPGAFPYEIWHYYTLNNQRNKRFVFYAREMVTNDFALIHSDAVGELSNHQWQRDIYSRTWHPQSVDEMRPPDAFGTRATRYWDSPY